jgi:nitroimidazol reductase NimA-like FMN-containing flavoprotein (pyridoxamine 5'-phosphate oxidase superfamily)
MTNHPAALRIEALDDDECHMLLAARGMGRVAFVVDGFPTILPVNFTLVGEFVVFRTDPGSKLTHLPDAPAAFEIDGRDGLRGAWSVLVQGRAHDLTTAAGEMFDRVRRATIDLLAPGDKMHWIGIRIERVSGRRILDD